MPSNDDFAPYDWPAVNEFLRSLNPQGVIPPESDGDVSSDADSNAGSNSDELITVVAQKP